MTDDKSQIRRSARRTVLRFLGVHFEELSVTAEPNPFVICHLSSVILLISLCLAGNAFGDGGSVQLHSVSGPFEITLFAEPPLPRAGQIDFSVLIQDTKSGQPVLDAAVTLAVTPVQVHQNAQPAWYPPSCAVSPPVNLAEVPLLHSGASNHLLYGALVEIPAAGVWHVRTEVRRGNERADVEGSVDVADPFPPIANYWPWFLFPVAAIGLYVLRERIRVGAPGTDGAP